MSLLQALVRQWHRAWVGAMAVASLATGLLAGAAVHQLAAWATLPVGAAGAAAAALVLLWRRRRVDAATVARHLNCTVPEVQRSADLLVPPVETLTDLQRLQRARVERVLSMLSRPPRLPRRALRSAVAYAALTGIASAALLTAAPAPRRGAHGPSAIPAVPAGPPRVTGVTVTIRAPRYTGQGARQVSVWDVEAEQDARLSWRIDLDRPDVTVALMTTSGDTLQGMPRGPHTVEVSLPVDRSLLYQLRLRGRDTTVTSDYHRVTVIPDAPPTLTVVQPEPRTEILPGAPRRVPIEVLATDDYAVTSTRIVATLTSGAGEAVKFREQTLDFDTRAARPGSPTGQVLRTQLDLVALGMQPGDELYFYVLARDNREPRSNEARSETYFVALIDTAALPLVADWSGFGVNVLPEYLRSQRQIIIDTEGLLARADRLTTAVFHERSNDIGFDQHLLRERYGQLTGEEAVQAGTEPTIEHEHDDPENATLLAPSVKQLLQTAVGQMWESELRLRTYDPRGALPFEYRALELLKQAQEAVRVYVQRMGFEPPPLEPVRRRLAGTLTGIGNPANRKDLESAPTFPALRNALPVAERLSTGGPARTGDAAVLLAAGQTLAQLAAADPLAHLETLRDVRALITSLDGAGSGRCRACALRVTHGLWRALPPPEADWSGRTAGAGALARTYFELLGEPERP